MIAVIKWIVAVNLWIFSIAVILGIYSKDKGEKAFKKSEIASSFVIATIFVIAGVLLVI